MLSPLQLDRGTCAFATAIVIVVAVIGATVILENPQSSFNYGILSGQVVLGEGGPPCPPSGSDQTTTLAPDFASPVVIVAQPQLGPGASVNIPILDWVQSCVAGERTAYGSIQISLIPGNYTLHLDCPDGGPAAAPCGMAVNPSLITMPNGGLSQQYGNTFSLQIANNKTTTMDVDIQSTIY